MRTPEQLSETLELLASAIKADIDDHVFEEHPVLRDRVRALTSFLAWLFGGESLLVNETLMGVQHTLGLLAQQKREKNRNGH